MLTNKIGIVIIEALHVLKEPASLKDIVDTVASLTKFTEKDVKESVEKSLEGGLRHGYIQKRRNKYAVRMFAADFVETIPAYHSIIKQQYCKFKPKPKPKSLAFTTEKKINLMQDTTDVMRTLFKSSKRMRTSDECSLKASVPCFSPVVAKKKPPTAKPSIKSLPASIKTPAHLTGIFIKKMNVKN